MKSLELVREFHRVFAPTSNTPEGGMPSNHVRLTRVQLIQEELGELAHALAADDMLETLDALTDLQYVVDGTYLSLGVRDAEYRQRIRPALLKPLALPAEYMRLRILYEMQKPLGKLTEALHGGYRYNALMSLDLFQLALDDAFDQTGLWAVRDAAFDEVHRSNMSKLGPGGKPVIDAAGRVTKGPGYSRPNLQQFLPA